jgi:hypothetical protein
MKKIFTFKTVSIFLLISMLPLFVSAQSAKSVRGIPGAKTFNSFILKELSASSVVATKKYVPGDTMILTFTLSFNSPDVESVGGFSMTFPAGITPLDTLTSDPLAPDQGCGYGVALQLPITQRLIWGDTTSTSGCGALPYFYTYAFQVNVIIGSGVSGVQTIDYVAYGDGYGAPSHTSTGTCLLDQALPNDIGIISVDNKMANLPGNIIPQVTIKNYGSNAQNNFNVRLKINSVPAYDQIVMITTTLDPDSATQVVFPAWNATLGNWMATATNLLATDVNPANDS